jgi:hypothetical protein
MLQLAITCHPCIPVPADELEQWLRQRVDELRADSPQSTIRLSRLTQDRPTTHLDIGWLIELELSGDDPLLMEDGLAEAIRDMRLLGLQPTLLVRPGSGGEPARDELLAASRAGARSRGNGWPSA